MATQNNGNITAGTTNSQYFIDNNAPQVSTAFYLQKKAIDGTRWSSSYPYQLMIVYANKDPSNNTITYQSTPFTFTLPIAPQDLSINMPLATIVQPTLTGIVEQHGGAPFRDIAFSGTTGITPIKNSADPQDSNSFNALLANTANSIFAGTVSSAQQALTSARNVTGANNFTPNVNSGLSRSYGC